MGTSLLPVDEYLTALRQNGLIVSTELNEAIEAFRDGGHEETVDAIGRFLMERKLLTLWQHRRVARGQARQCFLDKYKLLAPLGPKGTSATFLAVHTRMRRKVGIKLLPLKHDSGPDTLEKFLTEAEAVARLDHDNIVRAYEVDNKGDLFYLVMEYVEGRALSRIVIEQGPLEFRTAAEYLRQAADGLAHAHAAGIVHHDIKPGNLLLSSQGTVKVLELGVALLDHNQPAKASYAAPEQIAGSAEVDARADVYALGATLYFLLAGRPPFEGQRGEQAQPLAELRPDVPRDLAELCRWMLAAEPSQRPKSARRVSRLLTKWLAGETIEIPAPPPPAPVVASEPPPTEPPLAVAPADELPGELPTEPQAEPAAAEDTKMLWLSAVLVALLTALVSLAALGGKV